MTDRLKGFVITLENDIRVDDAQAIIEAIKMVRGVLTVQPVTTNPIGDSMIESRVRADLGTKLFNVIYPDA